MGASSTANYFYLFPNSHYKNIMQHFYSNGLNARDFFSFSLRLAKIGSVQIFNKVTHGLNTFGKMDDSKAKCFHCNW